MVKMSHDLIPTYYMKNTKRAVLVSWNISIDLTFYHMHIVLYIYYSTAYRFHEAESGFGKRKKKKMAAP